jgi:hypothetical protein
MTAVSTDMTLPRAPWLGSAQGEADSGTQDFSAFRHRAVQVAVVVLSLLLGGLAVLGGIGSFATVRMLAVPWFGVQSAWIAPVGIDIGILVLLGWDLLAEFLEMPWPVLRWVAWAFIGGTVYLNVAAAHGNPVGSVMHASMPSLFIVATEGVRHMIRHLAGLASGTRIEGIPFARWLLAPRSSFLLWRRMVLWHVTSYHHALGLEHARILAVSRLQEAHGRLLWRWKAPLSERLALRLVPVATSGSDALAAVAPAETAGSSPAAPPEAEPASSAIPAGARPAADGPSLIPLTVVSLLPKRHDVEIDPPGKAPIQLSERDRQLVEAASGILRDAEENGTPLSQAALARDLRSQGLAIANDRLRWLMNAAGERPSTRRSSTTQGES